MFLFVCRAKRRNQRPRREKEHSPGTNYKTFAEKITCFRNFSKLKKPSKRFSCKADCEQSYGEVLRLGNFSLRFFLKILGYEGEPDEHNDKGNILNIKILLNIIILNDIHKKCTKIFAEIKIE
jgi:hypothetical protein